MLQAQNIAGTWQGTLTAFGRQLREVAQVTRTDSGWAATLYSIDLESDGVRSNRVVLQGPHVVMEFPLTPLIPFGASYDGQLDSSGRTITGTWIQPNARLALTWRRVSGKDAWPMPGAHTSRFVPVDTNVKLEVLDWGGTGPPIVFLAGLGGTAHAFDLFAPKFAPRYHVYGITRRGFGQSSAPAPGNGNYTATRLGDDVLAVLDSLHLARPTLIGHSVAGEELSAVGSRHPDRVAGLVYLDAGYAYAYYDSGVGNVVLDRTDLIATLHRLDQRLSLRDSRAIMRELLETDLPRFERDLRTSMRTSESEADSMTVPPERPKEDIGNAIIFGGEKFTRIPVPVLAIFAVPHDKAPPSDSVTTAAQANALAAGVPTARVVRLPHANHAVFISNEADVRREMNAFLSRIYGTP